MKDIQEEGTDTKEHLAPDEFIEALKAISPDDKMKLLRIDRGLRGGTGRGRGELYHEAQCATILGERRCPRGTALVAYLIQTMRSIASHDRERLGLFAPGEVEDYVAAMTSDGTTAATNSHALAYLTPEQLLIEREEREDSEKRNREAVATIFALFDQDKELDCQLVLRGWMDGLHGKALHESVGADQKQFDYLSKKIWRRVEKRFPNGYWQ